MEVRYITSPSSELYHHGIKGQRWGIRRFQNYDGTLIGAKKRKEKKLTDEEKARRNKKIAAAIAVTSAVTIAAAAAYVAHNKYIAENVDQIINSDKLSRVDTIADDISNTTDRAYYSNNVFDNLKYKGWYGKTLSSQKVYQKTFKADNVKLASNKSARETFQKLYDSDSTFKKNVDEQIELYRKYFNGNPEQRKLFRNASFSTQILKKNDKSVYDAFNATLGNRNNKAANTFYKALKDKGYDAIRDMNDSKYSGYNAKSAKIVFNGSKVTQTAVKELSNKEISNDYVKATYVALAQKYAPKALPAVTTAGMAAGSTGYAYYNSKEKKLYNNKGKTS